MKTWMLINVILLSSAFARAQTFSAEPVLKNWPVHPTGDLSVFATRFDYRDNMLFLVQVEPEGVGESHDLSLQTVVYKGVRLEGETWKWERTVIDSRTLLDPWHNQASVALDKKGHIHIAYNMHNMPWQYVVSRKPYDISSFEFRGEKISQSDREAVKRLNRTPFPTRGSGAIAGNQITYPMFFSDRQGELYITYRFALRPARKWEERGFAGAVARYDVDQQKWVSVGGEISVSASDVAETGGPVSQRPFAYHDGFTVYLITLAFDEANGMHVFWNWRADGAGVNTTRPSYAYAPDRVNFRRLDGGLFELPANLDSVSLFSGIDDSMLFYAPKSVSGGKAGRAIAVFHPIGAGRTIWSVDIGSGLASSAASPYGASSVVIDNSGRQWAFASGVRVFMRDVGREQWTFMGSIGSGLCSPIARYFSKESLFMIHAKSCETQSVSVFSFNR